MTAFEYYGCLVLCVSIGSIVYIIVSLRGNEATNAPVATNNGGIAINDGGVATNNGGRCYQLRGALLPTTEGVFNTKMMLTTPPVGGSTALRCYQQRGASLPATGGVVASNRERCW